MFCFDRGKPVRLPDDDTSEKESLGDDLLDLVYNQLDEKQFVPRRPDEEEMQRRLSDLRARIKDAKVDWYIVPSEDEHQSEVVAEGDKRREWISNFDGSAGVALVPSSSITDTALLFVDSRYWIKADAQIPKSNWEVRRVGASGGSGRDAVIGGWQEFVATELDDGMRVGIDPKLIGYNAAKALNQRLNDLNTKIIPLEDNLIDLIHAPAERSLGPITPYPVLLSGEDTSSKISRMRKVLRDRARTDNWIYLIPTLSTLAWLFNYRCRTDVVYEPVAYAYGALTPDAAIIFVDERKVHNEGLQEEWQKACVTVRPYGVAEVGHFVQEAIQKVRQQNKDAKVKILASDAISWGLVNTCSPNTVFTLPCPINEAKCLKNDVELQNFRNAYLRDGRAMVRWLSWLETKLVNEDKKIGEWAAGEVLTRFRRQEDMFAGLAYDNISATGPNAANPHYSASRGNETVIDLATPYVIDAGPQYLDATIDTTRTWFFGKSPTDDMKRAYTRVLQGHMAVATQTFPTGTDAYALGIFSRKFLFDDGLDFGHGLGHGVGNYGQVHEYPTGFNHGFSFKAGHVTTIEPGFYLEGQWGIRIESVYICKHVETKYEFGGNPWLGWELVTQVPIDTRMVDWGLLTKDEMKWVNAHNTNVQEAILPLLDDDLDHDAKEWLKRVCKPHFIWPWP